MAQVQVKAGEDVMVTVQLSFGDKAIVVKALEVYQATRLRMRNKELTGSEMYGILSREIDALHKLRDRFFS